MYRKIIMTEDGSHSIEGEGGLNVLLSFLEAASYERAIHYEAVEAYPLEEQLTVAINYCRQLGRMDLQPVFEKIHGCPWETTVMLSPVFSLYKSRKDMLQYTFREPAELVYFDAFAPEDQPELWDQAVFDKLYRQMAPGALLLTYCSKGTVRRALQAAGFRVEKVPGPPGKREIVRAMRMSN